MIFLHSVIVITFIECKHDNLTARSVITLLSISMISSVRKKDIEGTIMSITCIMCCDSLETTCTGKCTDMLDTLFLFFSFLCLLFLGVLGHFF